MSASSRVVSPGGAPGPDAFASNDATETQVGAWQWDFGAGIFSVDPLWCSAIGINACPGPDHLEGWVRQIHPDDVAEFQRKRDAVRLGRLARFELEYRVLVDETRWLWLLQRGRVVEHGSHGLPLRVAGIWLEVDERKRAEGGLQEDG